MSERDIKKKPEKYAQLSLINRIILLIPTPHNPNPTPRHIPKPQMEPSKLRPNHKEHPKRRHRVLRLRQERWSQAERKRYLRGLVEIRFEHGAVEDE